MEITVLHDLVLENERVKLSPLLPQHYGLLEPVALQDKTLLQYSPNQVYSPGLLKQYIETAQTERTAGTRYAFVVFDKQKQQYAGSTSYGSISWYDKRIEIGWTWIGRDFQQTGLNRQMKFLMLQYVFESLGFDRLELRTDERNNASRNAMVKIGCKFEGILREHMLLPDGHRRSTVYYSILKNEWPGVKKHIFGQH
jgi:RimJ/RimL family protein N-acetyltransferase